MRSKLHSLIALPILVLLLLAVSSGSAINEDLAKHYQPCYGFSEQTIKKIETDLAQLNEALAKQVEIREARLQKLTSLKHIADLYAFGDIAYLEYINKVEQEFELEEGQLLAIAAKESEFRNVSVVEHDGITSYGVFQMRLPTALIAHKLLTQKYGLTGLPKPTAELLREDRYYQATLAGAYVKYLAGKNRTYHESFAEYNAGVVGKERFRDSNYRYSYSVRAYREMRKFQALMAGR